ncbi:MAG: DNA internalization-related competence protein ComEC/Rec2 [Nitrospirota bacterium]
MSYFGAFIVGVAWYHASRFFPFSSSVLAALLFIFAATRRRSGTGEGAGRSRMLLFCCALAALAASGFFHARAHHAATAAADGKRTITASGVARESAAPLRTRPLQFVQTVDLDRAVDGSGAPVSLREVRLITGTALSPDEPYAITATLSGTGPLLNPGMSRTGGLAFPRAYAVSVEKEKGAPGGLFGTARMRLRNGIKSDFSEQSASFLLSILIGDRALLTREVRDAFNATGLAHILSISGTHFGLLFIVVFAVFRALFRYLPYRMLVRVTRYATPSQIAAACSLPFIIVYLGISSGGIPALRAFIMILVFLFALLIQRRGLWLVTLLCAAAVILLLHPAGLGDLSFQLSFIAVLCIGIAVELRRSAPEGGAPRDGAFVRESMPRKAAASLRRFAVSSALISSAAALGTAPLVAYSFHYVSLIAPVTNLLITPLIGAILLPTALLSSFVFLLFDRFPFSSLIDMLTASVLSLVERAARLPGASLSVPAFPPALLVSFYGALLIFIFMAAGAYRSGKREQAGWTARRHWALLALGVVPFAIYVVITAAAPGQLCVTFLDVGQGDAAVAELPDGKVLVIDTGSNGFPVSAFLRSRGITTIDALILSHGQSDHAGGLDALIDDVAVKELWDNGRLYYSGWPEGHPDTIAHRGLSRGDAVRGKGYVIDILHPYPEFYSAGPPRSEDNNASLAFRLQGRTVSFLFAGDLEKEGLENIAHLGAHLKSTVLKAPHHGSRSSASAAFFRHAAPEVAVFSVGRNNRYGHPHEAVTSLLVGAEVLRTDRDGAVAVCERPDSGIAIKRARDLLLREASTLHDEVVNFKNLFLVW